MTEDINEVGERLAEFRQQANVTQEELANELNVSRQAVSNWERGKTQPDISTAMRICGYFGISMDEFLRGERNMSKGIDAKDNKKEVNKYDMAVGLFYAVGLFLGAGFFFVLGLLYNQPMVWGASFLGGMCLFLVIGLASHGLITILRKDK